MLEELSLFVYGAFSKGMVLAHHLERYVAQRQPATARGLAFRLPVGYPALVLPSEIDGTLPKSGQLDHVPGELLKIQGPEVLFRLLDELNGFLPLNPQKSLFLKQRTLVETISGQLEECFVYALNPMKLPKNAERIEGGDWPRDFESRPALTRTLSERQAMYVKRLSQCSGREVIPIDMDLYRELLKLELIVDKGRRLALTQLGKEVARFLP